MCYDNKEHLNECGLTTLETRRLRGDQIELNGCENIDICFSHWNKLSTDCMFVLAA